MIRSGLHICCLLGLLLAVTACGKDNEYHYPSVKLEFVTVESGPDGSLQALLPDKGERLAVANDYTGATISPNSARRVLSNYEVEKLGDNSSVANIYSLQSLIVPEPKFKGEPGSEEPLAKDPVDVTSIWMGRDYLNMILSVKVKGDRPHSFRVLAEQVETDEATDGTGATENGEEGGEEHGVEKNILLTLCHNANGDEEYYKRNAYVSIPLTGLGGNTGRTVRIKFKYYTYDQEGGVVESDKYCNADFEGFEYIP